MTPTDFATALASADQIGDLPLRRLVRSALLSTVGRLTRRTPRPGEDLPVDLVAFEGYLREAFTMALAASVKPDAATLWNAAMPLALRDLRAGEGEIPARLHLLVEMFQYAFENLSHLQYLAAGGEPLDLF
jgi:hypothetical protein